MASRLKHLVSLTHLLYLLNIAKGKKKHLHDLKKEYEILKIFFHPCPAEALKGCRCLHRPTEGARENK